MMKMWGKYLVMFMFTERSQIFSFFSGERISLTYPVWTANFLQIDWSLVYNVGDVLEMKSSFYGSYALTIRVRRLTII